MTPRFVAPSKKDRNQREIERDLKSVPGVAVFSTHTVGDGFPDLVVSHAGVNYLFEVKAGDGKLNYNEQGFFATWRGQVDVIRSAEDALRIMGLLQEGANV